MTPVEVNRFDELYQRHLRMFKLQGKSQKTIDAYSRSLRRVSEYFDCCPDQLTPEHLEDYFVFQSGIVHIIGQRPWEPDIKGSLDIIAHSSPGNGNAFSDFSVRQSAFKL